MPTDEANAKALPRPRAEPQYRVSRSVVSYQQYISFSRYMQQKGGCKACVGRCCAECSCVGCLISYLPILEWLPKYKWRSFLHLDIVAGITVAIMSISHGISYSLLAGLPPLSGLVMSIFPVLAYVLLGTSRHISMGTFAVASIMTLKVVNNHSADGNAIEVANATAMAAAILHLGMALLRLGVLASLLSDPLVSSFLTGCAFQVAGTQLPLIFGVIYEAHRGYFRLPFNMMELYLALPTSNPAACIISLVAAVFLILCNELLRPCLAKRCSFPFPSELVAIVSGTIFSSFYQLRERHDVIVVGEIPSGFIVPRWPDFNLVWKVIIETIPIALVTYATVMSMGLSYGIKYNYRVRANQELLAMSAGNAISSVFMGLPLAGSLSRTALQAQTGGKTQLASFVSAMLMIIVIIWLGQYFAELPRCVLAAVIIVALKSNFLQIRDLRIYRREGTFELLTWILTFLTVVIVDIDIGLYVGIIITLLNLWVNSFRSDPVFLGSVAEVPAVYVDLQRHRNAVEISGIKIYRFKGAINFATRRSFYDNLNIQSIIEQSQILIVDLSMVSHMDMSGCRTLNEVNTALNKGGVRMLIACPCDTVYDCLELGPKMRYGPFDVFPSLHDAAEFAKACVLLP